MKTGKPALTLLKIVSLLCLLSVSDSGFSVTSGADFLKIPKDPKVIALGDATSGAYDSLMSLEYNPAGMRSAKCFSLALMSQKWIGESYGFYLAGSTRMDYLMLGASVYYLDYGTFTRYDDWGGFVSEGTPHDLYARITAAIEGKRITEFLKDFTFGGSAIFIERNMLDCSVFGGLIDAGVLYRFRIPQPDFLKTGEFSAFPITLGLSVQNLGYSSDNMTPVKGSLGIKAGIITNFNLYADFTSEYAHPFQFKAGLEYEFFGVLALRAGYNTGKDYGNLAMGAGLFISVEGFDIRVDYAFLPMDSMGNNHTLSLSLDIPVLNPAKPRQQEPLSEKTETLALTVNDILDDARKKCKEGYLSEAIEILKKGALTYPDNRKIIEALTILTSDKLDIIPDPVDGK